MRAYGSQTRAVRERLDKRCIVTGCGAVHRSPGPFCCDHAHFVDFDQRPGAVRQVGDTINFDYAQSRRKPKHGLGG